MRALIILSRLALLAGLLSLGFVTVAMWPLPGSWRGRFCPSSFCRLDEPWTRPQRRKRRAAAIWWIYFENLEHRIYGRALGTGQTVSYLHLVFYIALGGIANTIRFAVDQALTLFEYKWLAGASTVVFVIALEGLHLTYHQKSERGAVLRHGAAATRWAPCERPMPREGGGQPDCRRELAAHGAITQL